MFQRFHLPAIARVPTIALTAACDTDPTRLTWPLPGSPRPTFFSSPADLLGYSRLDALLVLTPPSDHAGTVVRAMNRGLHVLVEKPMALDPSAAGEMLRAAGLAQRHLQVGFSRRFREPYRRLRAVLKSLGAAQIRGVHFELAFPTGSWKAETDFLGDDAQGGGVLDDVLSHQVDLVSWILGARPQEVRATPATSGTSSIEAGFQVDDFTVHCKAAHARYLERLEIELADGIVLEASGSRMHRTDRHFPQSRRARALLADRLALARDRLLRRPNATLVSFERQLRDFEDGARGRKSEGATGEDGLLAVKVVQACRASARQGGVWVPV